MMILLAVPRVTRTSAHTKIKKSRNWKLLKSTEFAFDQLKQRLGVHLSSRPIKVCLIGKELIWIKVIVRAKQLA